MRARLLFPLGAMALAAGCAMDRLTLLDNEAGSDTGSVAVIAPDGSETILDRAISEAALRFGKTQVRVARAFKQGDREVFAFLPPPPMVFRIPYDTAQSALKAEQLALLDRVRAEASKRPGVQLEVAGFTDSMGTEDANNRLSLDRARNVATQLRSFGFEIEDGDAIARGEYEAVEAVGDEREDPQYRAVEVILR